MVKAKDKDFEEIFEEIENGVAEYDNYYMMPKGSMSTKMYEELKNHFKCWEEFVSDEMIEDGIEGIEEPLRYTERWHYCFTDKE